MKNLWIRKAICALAILLTMLVSLTAVSCVSNEGDKEDTTAAGSTSDNTSESVTEGNTEITSESTTESASETETDTESDSKNEETAAELPERFDYFSADISEYLSIDESAYTNMTVSVSNSFLTTENDIDEYIAKTLFAAKTVANDGAHVTDVPMKKGDTAYIYYRGVIDGEEFAGGSNMEDENPTELSLGSGKFIPGFEDALVGVTPANTSREEPYPVQLTFPENYNPAVAGKDVTFYVVVEYAVQYDIPEYNEDSIKNVFKFEAEEGEDITQAHRTYIKSLLDEKKKPSLENAVLDAVWEKLLDAAKLEKYPESEVEFYMAAFKQQFESYYSYYMMMGYQFESFDDFAIQYMGLEDGADWRSELEKTCREMVMQNLIYHAIAVNEGIVVDDEAYNDEVDFYVEYYKDYTKEEIIENLGENEIRESALYRLTITEYVVANCTVNYDAEEE